MTDFLTELCPNYHQRNNRVSFGLSLKYVSYIYHSKRSKCAVSKFPTCLSSFRFVPQWTSPVAAGDRWLNLPQGQQMPAARYFSGCLQTGSAPLQLSRRIHTLTCLPDPHGQVWVGPCWLKPAGAYQAKFSFPGCHEVHLTLASKSLDTQPACFVQMPNADVQNTI